MLVTTRLAAGLLQRRRVRCVQSLWKACTWSNRTRASSIRAGPTEHALRVASPEPAGALNASIVCPHRRKQNARGFASGIDEPMRRAQSLRDVSARTNLLHDVAIGRDKASDQLQAEQPARLEVRVKRALL